MTNYQLTRAAQGDLEEILDYVAQTTSFEAALRVEELLIKAARSLGEFPGKGHINDRLSDDSLRIWTETSWVFVYRPDKQPIEIVRILHGAREIGAILRQKR